MTFDVRLRLLSDSGAKQRILKTQTLTVTQTDSSSPTVEFTVSRRVAGNLETPMVVGIEYLGSDGKWRSPRNDLLIIDADEADALDPTKTVRFSGQGIIPWLMQRMPLWWGIAGDGGNERTYTNVTAGHLMRTIIQRAQREYWWGPHVRLDFDDNRDSAGNAWDSRITQTYPFFTTALSTVLNGISEQGYAEWWTEGWLLRLNNAGTGADRRDVVLGGRGFTRAPARSKFDPVAVVLVQYDEGWTHFTNSGYDGRFGQTSKVMTQSGVKDRATAEKNVQPTLTAGRTMARELSYEWTPAPGMPAPWESFDIGDLVTARTAKGREVQRAVGFVVTKTESAVTITAVVGSRMLSHAAKMARRTSAATTGTVIGGSGAAVPSTPVPAGAAPAAPSGVRVNSSTSEWGADGSAQTAVSIGWNEVTQDVAGNRIDVVRYAVSTRIASAPLAVAATVDDTEASFTGLAAGVARYIAVRAQSRAGVWSAWSDEISVTPAVPTSIVPKAPEGVSVASNAAEFGIDGLATARVRLVWDAVDEATDGTAVEVDTYQVEIEDGEVWSPLAELGATEATFTIPTGVTRRARVRARSRRNAWGDPSTPVTVTGAAPEHVRTALAPPTLTTAQGLVHISSNGKLSSGAAVPASFQLTYAETAPAATGPWTRVGVPARAAGQVATVRGTAGSTMFARLVWVDTLGRAANPSAASSIVVKAIVAGDIDKAITDSIEKAAKDADDARAEVGRAIRSSLDEYVVSDSASTAPPADAAWSSDTPDWQPGQYVWRRTKNTHIDDSVTYSAPVVITGADGTPGEDAVLLRVFSSRGTSFKNNAISTVLSVVVFRGAQQITNVTDLHAAFGTGAFIEWWWRRFDDSDFGVISSADSRLSQAGFALTVSPADVDEQTVFQAILHT
ncbi:hypothetical protein O1W71_01915 [Microbacterium sp. H37-C3]|uniref:hypothetical protein n=1 Tax=Microbacterium sp. H37-C3 TaxID=3004354 RepID=UPI0022AE99E8|nr:hypothetical protein [Microbacterium sp. H37-C3]MCZ4066424.1 hypothetical protein [Microbacterium sp. H37-C3]